MNATAFPATPGDVAALTVQEFTLELDELDGHRAASLERVCRTFMDDANRALVWWIRFGAVKAWCARTGVLARLTSGALSLRDTCEVAAGFPLNHRWEFEPEDLCSAIEAVTVRRAQARSIGAVRTANDLVLLAARAQREGRLGHEGVATSTTRSLIKIRPKVLLSTAELRQPGGAEPSRRTTRPASTRFRVALR